MKTSLFSGVFLYGAARMAFAHDDHGMAGSHWHATDVFGFAIAVALAAAGLWWLGRK